MSATQAPLPTPGRLVAVIDELRLAWSSPHEQTELEIRGGTRAKVPVVFGLAAHAFRLAGPAVRLLEQGQVVEAMPQLRAIFECAITAQWTVQMAEGEAALVNEEVRQRRALVRTMTAASRSLGQLAGDVVVGEGIPTRTNVSTRQFHQVCLDLEPGGEDAYAIYRMMSQMAHASAFTIDAYLRLDDGPAGFALDVEPVQPDAEAYLGILAYCLVWSARAVDLLDKNKHYRPRLLRLTRELQISSVLKASAVAHREGRADRS